MTMTIELPQSALEALASEARRQGTTPEQLAADDLLQRYAPQGHVPQAGEDALPQTAPALPQTGAEVLAIMEREGLFLNRDGQPDSPELARQIREEAQQARSGYFYQETP